MTSFAPNVAAIYLDVDLLSREYTGWNLTEIKKMPRRVRKYWLDLVKWRNQNG